ncbi:MAG: hypothetical protein RLZZ403_184 [Pseudomonadota bacterium]
MPFRLLLLFGAIGGLTSVLVAALLRSLLSAATLQATGPQSPSALLPSWRDIFEAATHVFSGAGIGLVFWLSWGFAAIVTVPWWVRGVAFGGTCALVVAVPALLGTALRTGLRSKQAAGLLIEWTYTCVMAGLACAWVAEATQ